MTELNFTRTPAQLFSKRLTYIKFSQLIIEDLDKIDKVNKKILKERYLLYSYILNLVASWQVFVEDLARYATTEMINRNTNSHLNTILRKNLAERIKRFNTPNPENIDTLFENVTGIENVTGCLEPTTERKQIDEILKIRHAIAHTGDTKAELSISSNFERMETLMKAAKKIEELVRDHIDK